MRFVLHISFYIFILLPITAFSSDLRGDFITLCDVFSETLELNADVQVRSQYLTEQINARISSIELIETYDVLFHVDPKDRYSILQDVAEHYTGKPWKCVAAKNLLTDE